MIDTHAHLYFDRFDEDRDDVVRRARTAGVEQIINVGIDAATSRQAVGLAASHQGFRAAVGVHPSSQIDSLGRELDAVRSLALEHPGLVVAIGEIGLDYHWKDIPRDEQRNRLAAQLDLALELDLPVIFHCREALPDLFSTLVRRSTLPRGVFHCFSGDAADARRTVELGFHISFAGNVTYPRAGVLREAARYVPSERLLLETDAPFLPPQRYRGQRNEPAFVAETGARLAELRGTTLEVLAATSDAAARELFALAGDAGT